MKKVLTKIVTLLVALVLALGAFSGCGLVTTNTDRDMAQVVASLSIGSGNENKDAPAVHKDYFLKKELLAGYMSYGYYYVSSYGYTVSQAYSTILESLIQSAVIVQQAKIGLAEYYISNKDNTDANTFEGYYVATINSNVPSGVDSADVLYNAGVTEAEYEAASKSGNYEKLAEYLGIYLTDYEKAQAKYTVLNSISSMIETYKESDDEENDIENETFTARATPTEETEDDLDEHELKGDKPTDYEYKVVAAKLGNEDDWSSLKTAYTYTYDLNKHLYDSYEVKLSSNEDKSALNKAIKQLKKNGLISSNENRNNTKPEEVIKYSYFQYLLKSQYESLIVSKYERSLKANAETEVANETALEAQFVAEYRTQWENYNSSYSAYETALDSATEDAPVYCNPYDGYGYVLNLLIGFTDEQTEILDELNSKAGITTEQKAANRAEMLKHLIVKDQRTTWVQSSYGTLSEGRFTFDDKYLVSETTSMAYAMLNSYKGTTVLANEFKDKDDSGVATTTYSFKNVYSTGMSFDDFINEYLSLTGMEKKIYTDGLSDDRIGTLNNFTNDSDVRKAFDDLMYAFSTDTGCLGKAFGYTYSPKTSASTYVKEFADAAAAVVNEGVGAYTIVATQYGYHIILCTKTIAKDDVLTDGKLDDAKIRAYYNDKVKADYRDIKIDSLLSDYVTKISNMMVNEYIDKAEYFSKAYSDLIETDDDPAVDSSAN